MIQLNSFTVSGSSARMLEINNRIEGEQLMIQLNSFTVSGSSARTLKINNR